MSSKPLTINVLTDVVSRGENWAFYALSADQEILEALIMKSSRTDSHGDFSQKIQKGNYYVIHKYSLNANQGECGTNYIRIYEDSSKIFNTGKSFTVNEDIVNGFFNPPLTTVPEALASPRKRKLSLEGRIGEVFPLKSGKNWKRRDFWLEDENTKTKIQCKLWGEAAHSVQPEDTGSAVKLKMMEVDIFNSRKHLKSLDLTTIEVKAACSSTESEEYHILGVDENNNVISVITAEGSELSASPEVFKDAGTTLKDFTEKTPLTVKLTVNDGTISKIEFLKDKK